MSTSTQSLDYIGLLKLDSELSPVELADTMNTLSVEVWYRILGEKLPQLLNQDETKKLLELSKDTQDLTPVLKWLEENRKDIVLNKLMEETSGEVKRDFALSYLYELKQLYSENEEKSRTEPLIHSIDHLVSLLQNEHAKVEDISHAMTELVKQKEGLDQ